MDTFTEGRHTRSKKTWCVDSVYSGMSLGRIISSLKQLWLSLFFFTLTFYEMSFETQEKKTNQTSFLYDRTVVSYFMLTLIYVFIFQKICFCWFLFLLFSLYLYRYFSESLLFSFYVLWVFQFLKRNRIFTVLTLLMDTLTSLSSQL